ncbi:response regulator [Pilimelia columellifera]|uniref:Response regulator n=1 Tax=Pilimelia columellifera subsp. columellifera TaxID=706583 RepID=A0ABP6AJE1_9ACTN
MRPEPILLVEDNADDIMFTIRAFRKNQVPNEIIVASDGVQALSMLLPEDGEPALSPILVLLDVKLPLVDGLEVLRRLRADPRTRTMPVVVMTTSNEERDIVESYRLGANSFVRKPVGFAEFEDAAKTLSQYWLRLNEPAPSWRGGG